MPETKQTAYRTMVRPTLEYAGIIWEPHCQKQVELERIQRLVARFIYSCYHRTQSVTVLLHWANLQKLPTRRQIAHLKFLYQLYNKTLNLDLSLYLPLPGQLSPRINHPYAILPYITRVYVFKFCFLPRTISQWNKLNCVFVDCQSPEALQRCLELVHI